MIQINLTTAPSKRCFKCSTVLPITEFYRHPMMGDGHLGKCKECTKRDSTARRNAKIEEVREYDRRRAKAPKRRAHQKRITKAWVAANPKARWSHGKLAYNVRAGKITRPTKCEDCGDDSRLIEAHHPDYSRPLDVEWLCKPCHWKADQRDLHLKVRVEVEP